jgi:hypothetical protein
MKLPETLEITNGCYLLDGGTTSLTCVDEDGEEHSVLLAQHAFRDEAIGWEPGRLYFDNVIIDVRSADETRIVNLLQNAIICYRNGPLEGKVIELSENRLFLANEVEEMMEAKPNENLERLRDSMVAYIRSKAFVEFLKT